MASPPFSGPRSPSCGVRSATAAASTPCGQPTSVATANGACARGNHHRPQKRVGVPRFALTSLRGQVGWVSGRSPHSRLPTRLARHHGVDEATAACPGQTPERWDGERAPGPPAPAHPQRAPKGLFQDHTMQHRIGQQEVSFPDPSPANATSQQARRRPTASATPASGAPASSSRCARLCQHLGRAPVDAIEHLRHGPAQAEQHVTTVLRRHKHRVVPCCSASAACCRSLRASAPGSRCPPPAASAALCAKCQRQAARMRDPDRPPACAAHTTPGAAQGGEEPVPRTPARTTASAARCRPRAPSAGCAGPARAAAARRPPRPAPGSAGSWPGRPRAPWR